MRSLFALSLVLIATSNVLAGHPVCRTYHYAQPTEVTTTVVNNLTGIPIPVKVQTVASESRDYEKGDIAAILGNVDRNLLFAHAAKLTDQAQQLAGSANNDFSQMVLSDGASRAQVAGILSSGAVARDAILAAKARVSFDLVSPPTKSE